LEIVLKKESCVTQLSDRSAAAACRFFDSSESIKVRDGDDEAKRL